MNQISRQRARPLRFQHRPPSAAFARLVWVSIQNPHLLPCRQHRLQHPFPNLSAFLQHVGVQRQAGFELQGAAVGADALLVQLHVDAVQGFVAAGLGDELLRQVGWQFAWGKGCGRHRRDVIWPV